MSDSKHPKVGVAAFLVRDGKILFGKRKNAHGEGSWGLPGGHLEFGESLEVCAARETYEETGIILPASGFIPAAFTNDVFDDNKHYVTLFVIATCNEGEAKLTEPDKCTSWEWFYWDQLPQPLFLPVQNLLKQNFNPIEFSKNISAVLIEAH